MGRDAQRGGIPTSELGSRGLGAITQPISSPRRCKRLALQLPEGGDLPLDRAVTIGQSQGNHVVLRDRLVSRQHCAIEPVGERVVVRDLDSTNGTFINGLRVTRAELTGGAVLSLGSSRLRVVADETSRTTIVGESAAIQELRQSIAVLAATELSVLIIGETGTGKELVARALHEQSERGGPFVPVNCGSIPKELVESELFGHERGAFTGAAGRRQGVFQEADGGTLFLDEIGELPLGLQSRLLRALENGVIRPVGADRERAVTVRVVAATHVDLRAAVRTGRFREDLYYRLAAAVVATPPLRARLSDLTLLVERIVSEVSGSASSVQLSNEAWAALRNYPWPGNVRELKNVLRRALILGGSTIEARDLCLNEVLVARDDLETVRVAGRPYLDIERDVLAKALLQHGGNKRAAAHALRIPKSTLCDKARRYGLGGG